MVGMCELLRPRFCDNSSCLGELWCSECQCCALADPQANDDADFKNPLLQKKLKLWLGKGKKRKSPRMLFQYMQCEWTGDCVYTPKIPSEVPTWRYTCSTLGESRWIKIYTRSVQMTCLRTRRYHFWTSGYLHLSLELVERMVNDTPLLWLTSFLLDFGELDV